MVQLKIRAKKRAMLMSHLSPPSTAASSRNASSHKVSSFQKLDQVEIEKNRTEASLPLIDVKHTDMGMEDLYPPDQVIQFPRRPPWKKDISAEQLESAEAIEFRKWRDELSSKFGSSHLSYFEENIEVWRQLWRVEELSDILLVLADVRNPLFHLPPSIYTWIVEECRKPLILVLTKSDLVDDEEYIQTLYPKLVITSFSSNPKQTTATTKNHYKKYFRALGVTDVIDACRQVSATIPHDEQGRSPVGWDELLIKLDADMKDRDTKAQLALAKAVAGRAGVREGKMRHGRRRRQIMAELEEEELDLGDEEKLDDDETSDEEGVVEDGPAAGEQNVDRNFLTIGLIGHPNVGKSSLINALKGKKVVGVGKQPGFTKTFQTIYLAPHLRLADCPGLVFPSLVPRHVQIVSGIFSIAQVQEPLSCVRFIGERIDLVSLLRLNHPDQHETPNWVWSPFAICEAYASAKGFLNAKGGRLDVHRAANLILRMVAEGRIVLSFKPPGIQMRTNATASPGGETPALATKGDDSGSGGSELEEQEELPKQGPSKAEKKRLKTAQRQMRLMALSG